MPDRVAFRSLSFTSAVALVVGLLFASAALAQGPPSEPQLWSAVSTLDALSAARTCAADPVCTSYDPPAGLQIDPATGQPLLSVHAKGAMDVGPLLDWAAAHPEVVLVEKLVHVFDMTGFEVDVSMDLLDAEAWTSLRDALELMASTAYVSLHGIPVQAEGIHPDLAAAHGAIQACGGDPGCLQDLHELWPWLDAELAIGALQIEVPHNGDPGQHDAIAAELESLTWTEPPWIFGIEPVAGGEHVTRAVGRMPSTQLDGLTAWLAGQPWSARSRPMVEDELSEVRLRLETADAAADVFACGGDMGCHYDVSTLHQAVVSPGGRLGVLLHGEDPDIEGLNGLEYPGWSMAPAGYAHDGEAGLLEHQALRELGLGRWDLGEALSVGLDRNPELVGLSWEDWTLAWGPDDEPWTWEYALPMPGQVLAVDTNGFEYAHTTIQDAIDAADDGWSVYVGEGTYDELIQVSGFTGLTIAAGGPAEVLGAQVDSSAGLVLRLLDINAAETGQPGISLTGGSEVEVDRCQVHDADEPQPGLLVEPGSQVTAVDSRLHHNGGYGLVLPADETRVHILEDNIVDGNVAGGVLVKQGARAQLTGNRVFVNEGYGLELERDGQPLEPERVELFGNTIAMNGGEKVQEESSQDLGTYPGLLDGLDEDNVTSRGDEHSSVGEIARPDLVWQGLPDDEELALSFPQVSQQAMDGLIAGRDAIVAARTTFAVEEEQHHPVLFDIDFDEGNWEPYDTTDCYGPYYDQPTTEVDYIADAMLGVVIPPWAPTIHEALTLAAIDGDRTGDGVISICVMPGVYPGGFAIDATDYIPFGTPEFRLFGAGGPDVTIIEGWWDSPWPDPSDPAWTHGVIVSRPAPPVVWPVFVGGLTVRGFGKRLWDLPPATGAAMLALDGVELTMNHVRFERNTSNEEGGGLRAEGTTLVVRNAEFDDNRADETGGGLHLRPRNSLSGSLELIDSNFGRFFAVGGNRVTDYFDLYQPPQGTAGAAVAIMENTGPLSVEISGFFGNETELAADPISGGGAIFVRTAAADIDTSWFIGNHSANGGALGLGWDMPHAASQVTLSTFAANAATGSGGAIAAAGQNSLTLHHGSFLRNTAVQGGAVYGSRIEASAVDMFENGLDLGGTLVAAEGGAVYLFGESTTATSTFVDCHFTSNEAQHLGGAVLVAEASGGLPGSPVDFTNCPFQQNEAGDAGGGLYSRSSDLHIFGPVGRPGFVQNHADEGGGANLGGGTSSVEWTSFEENEAELGGGVFLDRDATFADCSFAMNLARDHGGGAYVAQAPDGSPGSPVSFIDGGFDGDTAGVQGGGIHSRSSALAVDGTSFVACDADEGAGMYLAGGDANTVLDASFTGGTAAFRGGAIVLDDIWSAPTTSLSVSGTSFIGNSSGGTGGAVAQSAGQITVAGSTFSWNQAEDRGGAVAVTDTSTVAGSPNVTMTIHGGEVSDNWTVDALSMGGAVFCGNDIATGPQALVTLDQGAWLEDNTGGLGSVMGSSGGGGAVAIWNNCDAYLEGVTLTGNDGYTGGGLRADGDYYLADNMVTVVDSEFSLNNATGYSGGGMATGRFTEVVMENSDLDDNSAAVYGGGFYAGWEAVSSFVARPVSLEQVDFEGNYASSGGGLCVDLVQEPATFSHVGGGYYDNVAGTYGGGAYLRGAGLDVQQVEFFANEASAGGGPLSNGVLSMNNVLVAHNLSNDGAVRAHGGQLDMSHVTVTGNRWLASGPTTGLSLMGGGTFDVSNSVIGYNDGEVQVFLEENPLWPGQYPSGNIDEYSLLFTDTGGDPLEDPDGGCVPCDQYQEGDPLFYGDGSVAPYDPGANYWTPPNPDYDLHPSEPSSPLLCAADETDPPAHIGAFGGAGWDWDCTVGCSSYLPPSCPP